MDVQTIELVEASTPAYGEPGLIGLVLFVLAIGVVLYFVRRELLTKAKTEIEDAIETKVNPAIDRIKREIDKRT
jgi:hypothetical protein